jgi:hypothetical protein
MQEGFIRKDINAEVVMEGISVLYNAISKHEQFKVFEQQAWGIFFNTIGLTIRGFCTAKGADELDTHVEDIKAAGGVKAFKKTTTLT